MSSSHTRGTCSCEISDPEPSFVSPCPCSALPQPIISSRVAPCQLLLHVLGRVGFIIVDDTRVSPLSGHVHLYLFYLFALYHLNKPCTSS